MINLFHYCKMDKSVLKRKIVILKPAISRKVKKKKSEHKRFLHLKAAVSMRSNLQNCLELTYHNSKLLHFIKTNIIVPATKNIPKSFGDIFKDHV